MTATDELRRLLDERGVEWMPSVFDRQHETFYEVNGVGFIVTEFPEIQRMSLACDMRITPKQAVEATLGRGTCRNVGWRIDLDEFECSECGYDGWTKWAIDHRDRVPNYCPNCGRRVVGV